jgi:nucleoside 2-deoxyribosyltransferase
MKERTLRVYLAARFNRQAQMRQYRDELARLGITVTSRWLDEPSNDERVAGGQPPYSDADYAELAMHDLEDVAKADALVTFTESPDAGFTSGGRHVEYGYALALRKPVFVVGGHENIFHRIGLAPGYHVTIRADWHDALIEIARSFVEQLRDEPRHAAA